MNLMLYDLYNYIYNFCKLICLGIVIIFISELTYRLICMLTYMSNHNFIYIYIGI